MKTKYSILPLLILSQGLSTSALAQTPISDSQNGVTQIPLPGGEAYLAPTAETGAIKIEMPEFFFNTMLYAFVEIINKIISK